MMYDQALHTLRQSPPLLTILGAIEQLRPGGTVPVTGVPGSFAAFVLAALREQTGRPILAVMAGRDDAERLRDDLRLLLPPAEVRLFASSAGRQQEGQHPVEDVETLRALLAGDVGIVVTHPAGLLLRLPEAGVLNRRMLSLHQNEEAGFDLVLEAIGELGFEKTTFVSSPGEFAVRGGILDVYPFVGEHPIRCEFSGDTIESLREFDPLSQRSIKELAAATIVPDLMGQQGDAAESASSLLRFFPDDVLVVLEDPALLHAGLEEAGARDEARLHAAATVLTALNECRQLHMFRLEGAGPGAVNFGAVAQPAFNGNTRLLRRLLADLQQESYRIILAGDAQPELTRLKELLTTGDEPDTAGDEAGPAVVIAHLTMTHPALSAGFRCDILKLAVFTEHQVFNRQKRRSSSPRSRFRGFTDRELRQLRRGDFVVHADYGIGRFEGLQRIRVSTVEQEVLRLSYEDNDILYVNLNYVNRVQKYSSKEGHVPRLTKLGRAEWDRLKIRARKRIQDIARDLIGLYAQRKRSQGFACAPDAPWQKELEASFMYEDTFDQARTTREVKQDMEASFPMDRLVCGDVGFGKTEVAVRAAFKAVMNGKQAAVLVPTTILALQHYHTFSDRLAPYGTNIQVLSRFKSRHEQAAILDLAKSGTADIVIGTHRLLQKDVGFRDLGLLVIDEEHRFGVAAKEKLRKLKTAVDTLTLTATPIPRTLHFSLMGARDLSIIATPPRNRLPVVTEITQESGELIRDAVLRELQREGQVYVVHDRVHDIERVAQRLRDLLPGVGIRCAHGQMHAHELEDVMVGFLEKRFGVLVCTKIIESGLDIPNVNTIVINRADRFGMAELYQLRGRVGRSNIQAYAYLLTPPVETLARATLQRLQALEEFTELGAGFHLAMRDLEIRGAGNLLGAEQSGFIESMGFETYTRILEEAVAELKDQEFRDLFPEEDRGPKRIETAVDMDIPALLPADYVENDTERLELYRRLYGLDSVRQLEELRLELRDRFGVLPGEAEQLLSAVRIRLIVGKWGFPKVAINATAAEVEFPPETATAFYESAAFQEIMSRIGRMRDRGVVLKTVGKSLKLSVRFPPGTKQPAETLLFYLSEILPADAAVAKDPA